MEKKGYVFDFKRFATHDGNGIRTTVFLKGCTLNCVWCQNPEGISIKRRPLHFPNKCIGCGSCILKCRDNGIVRENGRIKLDCKRNEDWESVIDACPATALAMDSKEYTVSEVIEEVRKDEVFFRYDGGMTISGGEPLYQSDFATQILKRAQECRIHTAVETALNVPEDVVKKALTYLDSVYADMKIYDAELHQKYTGVSNELIKENLKFLLTSEKRDSVTVRTPLIPGFTTKEENLASISRFLSGIYPEVHYELLNYNPLAEAKYPIVEKEYCFKENPKMFTNNEMIHFGEIVKANGIRNLVLDI